MNTPDSNTNPTPPRVTRYAPSIRHKMVALMVLVLTVAFTVAGWWTLHDQQQAVIHETRIRGEDLATLMAHNMAPLLIGYDYEGIKLALTEYAKLPDISYAKVVSVRGNPMGEIGGKPPDNPELVFEKPIVFADKQIGSLVVGLNNNAIIAKMTSERKALVWRESLLAIMIALAEFVVLSYLVIRPLTTIARSLRRNLGDKGLLNVDIPINSSDEFGLIARLFNDLRGQLNQAHDQLNTKIELADAKLITANERLEEQAKNLQLLNEDLVQIAITDQLTRLYNRRHFDAIMVKELDLCRRYGDTHVLIMADIDHFKSVNDRYGHDVGDHVLRIMAGRLQENVRTTDIVFRLGGEEFGIFCRRASSGTGSKVAEKLRLAVAASPFMVNDTQIDVTASFGVAEMTAPRSVQEIYRRADAAMYLSKNNGRNQVTIDPADAPIT